MEPLDILKRARADFERRVRATTDWSAASPCGDWDARRVLHHVTAGNNMAVALLGGASLEESMVAIRETAPDADFASTADAVEGAFAAAMPQADSMIVHHPAGDMPVSQFFGFRVADYLLHAWDLARAAGMDETLDPVVVEVVWSGMEPMTPFIGQTGYFGDGPSGNVGPDAPLQTRLLDLSGRRP